MRSGLLGTCFIVVMICLLVLACDKRSIQIGFAGPLSGPYADLGVHGRNGAQLALEKINVAGGVAGRGLELVVRDDKGTIQGAVQAAEELIQARVTAIIGHMTSAQSVAALPVAQEAGMVLLSPTTSTPKLSGIKDVFFRVQPSTDTAAEALAEYAARDMGLTRLASVRDLDNQAYSWAFHQHFQQTFAAYGGTLVSELTVSSSSSPDWLAVARDLTEIAPEAVLFILSARDAAALAQALHALGQVVTVFSSGWAMTEELFSAGGRTVERIIFAGQTFYDEPSPALQDFEVRYQRRFGHWPSFAARYAYDAMHVLALALEQTRGRREGLPEALTTIRDYPGLDWPISIDPYGDTVSPIYITMVRDGQFTFLKKVGQGSGQ